MQTKYGHQEGAARGYNPVKPGRKSFHPLVAVGAGTRLCAAYRFRSGDTVTATQWQAAMADAQATLGGGRPGSTAATSGSATRPSWPGTSRARPAEVFVQTETHRQRAPRAPRPARGRLQGPGAAGVWQVAEARVRLPGWTAERRVVFARKRQGQTSALAQGQFWQQVNTNSPPT